MQPPESTINKTRGVFRTIAQFLREQESAPDAHLLAARQREEHRRWDELSPDALDYFEAAFEQNVNGDYLDPDRAERAARLVAQSQGWTEPEPPVVRPVAIEVSVIEAQMRAIAASDAAIHRPATAVTLAANDVQMIRAGDVPALG